MFWRGTFSSYFTLYQVIIKYLFFPLNPTLAPDFLAFKELFVDHKLMKSAGEGQGMGGGACHLAGLLAVSSISQVTVSGQGHYDLSPHVQAPK